MSLSNKFHIDVIGLCLREIQLPFHQRYQPSDTDWVLTTMFSWMSVWCKAQLVLDRKNAENLICKKVRRANYQFKPKKIQVVPIEGGKVVELTKAEKEYYVTGATI